MDTEKPAKRTITIEIEEQEKGIAVRVLPSFGHTMTMLNDLASGMGSVIGHSVTGLKGIKVISEEVGGVMISSAIQTYEADHGKGSVIAEALMALIDIKSVDLLKKEASPEMLEKFNAKCKACDKLSCPLCGKGLTDQTGEVTPECSPLH